MGLNNKNVLFISPKFFGYELEIKKELESQGARVDYYDERPKNSAFMKALIRLNLKKIIAKQIDRYYQNILIKAEEKKYD
jgi:hypothetical protein